jgi:hypothetical protein
MVPADAGFRTVRRASVAASSAWFAHPCWRATLLRAAIVAAETLAYSGWISVCSSASVSMSHLRAAAPVTGPERARTSRRFSFGNTLSKIT